MHKFYSAPVPDYKTRLAYIQEHNRMVGNHKSVKTTVIPNGKGGSTVLTEMRNLSDEELDKKIAQIDEDNADAESEKD